jgi:hypothetical protein
MGRAFSIGLILGGAALICWGVVACVRRDLLAGRPERMSVEQARKLVEEDGLRYVCVEGVVDPFRAVHATGLERPRYTPFPPQNPKDIARAAAPGDLEALLGAVVQSTDVRLDRRIASLSVLLRQAGEEARPYTKRLIAPLSGASYRVWVMSWPFVADEPAAERWKSRTRFEGRLCRLSDLNVNRPDLEHNVSDLIKFYWQRYSIVVPKDAVVILADRQQREQQPCYLPVQGAEGTLFVELQEPAQRRTLNAGRITGILRPSDSGEYGHFGTVLARRLPRRIGIITLQAPWEHNWAEMRYPLVAVLSGMVLAAVGAVFAAGQARQRGRAGGPGFVFAPVGERVAHRPPQSHANYSPAPQGRADSAPTDSGSDHGTQDGDG